MAAIDVDQGFLVLFFGVVASSLVTPQDGASFLFSWRPPPLARARVVPPADCVGCRGLFFFLFCLVDHNHSHCLSICASLSLFLSVPSSDLRSFSCPVQGRARKDCSPFSPRCHATFSRAMCVTLSPSRARTRIYYGVPFLFFSWLIFFFDFLFFTVLVCTFFLMPSPEVSFSFLFVVTGDEQRDPPTASLCAWVAHITRIYHGLVRTPIHRLFASYGAYTVLALDVVIADQEASTRATARVS